MRKGKWNNVPLGMLLGLLMPLLILVGINVFNFPQMSLGEFFQTAWNFRTLGIWLLPGLVFNLPIFFLFMNFNNLYSARGIISRLIICSPFPYWL